MAKKIKY